MSTPSGERNIIDLVNASEISKPCDSKRKFEYNLNEKAAKAKFIKNAKRSPFEVVTNSTSSNLLFSLGAWDQVDLSTVKYWNQVKGEKTCKVGSNDINIASVDIGKEVSGKHIDSKVVFYMNRNKVVCHLYNTTQLILVNGHGYATFIDIFLKPYFLSKVDLHLDGIARYNKLALETLGTKQV